MTTRIDGVETLQIAPLLAGAGILILVVCGLVSANILRDRGLAVSSTRRVAGTVGGGAYLIAVLAFDVLWAIALSALVSGLVLVLRVGFRRHLRGIAHDEQRWGEVAYVIAGTASLTVGWGIFGDRWLAFVPIAFMAWGDSVAGVVRGLIPGGETSLWPSIAMLGACFAAALLYQPYWVSALGAVAATAAERIRLAPRHIWDDNWVIVAASLTAMAVFAEA
jgi:dolichol kinase